MHPEREGRGGGVITLRVAKHPLWARCLEAGRRDDGRHEHSRKDPPGSAPPIQPSASRGMSRGKTGGFLIHDPPLRIAVIRLFVPYSWMACRLHEFSLAKTMILPDQAYVHVRPALSTGGGLGDASSLSMTRRAGMSSCDGMFTPSPCLPIISPVSPPSPTRTPPETAPGRPHLPGLPA